MSLAQRVRRLRRELQQTGDGEHPVFCLEGDPETARLGMTTEREALVGEEIIRAEDGERTEDFHRRMEKLTRSRGGHVFSVGYAPPEERPVVEPGETAPELPAVGTLH